MLAMSTGGNEAEWLMLGRGTRKCPELNKTKFVVFDCFDATLIQYFKNTTDFEIQPPTSTPLTLPQIIENIWQNVDRDYHVRVLAKRLRRIEKDMSGEARLEFAKWIIEHELRVWQRVHPARNCAVFNRLLVEEGHELFVSCYPALAALIGKSLQSWHMRWSSLLHRFERDRDAILSRLLRIPPTKRIPACHFDRQRQSGAARHPKIIIGRRAPQNSSFNHVPKIAAKCNGRNMTSGIRLGSWPRCPVVAHSFFVHCSL